MIDDSYSQADGSGDKNFHIGHWCFRHQHTATRRRNHTINLYLWCRTQRDRRHICLIIMKIL